MIANTESPQTIDAEVGYAVRQAQYLLLDAARSYLDVNDEGLQGLIYQSTLLLLAKIIPDIAPRVLEELAKMDSSQEIAALILELQTGLSKNQSPVEDSALPSENLPIDAQLVEIAKLPQQDWFNTILSIINVNPQQIRILGCYHEVMIIPTGWKILQALLAASQNSLTEGEITAAAGKNVTAIELMKIISDLNAFFDRSLPIWLPGYDIAFVFRTDLNNIACSVRVEGTLTKNQ